MEWALSSHAQSAIAPEAESHQINSSVCCDRKQHSAEGSYPIIRACIICSLVVHAVPAVCLASSEAQYPEICVAKAALMAAVRTVQRLELAVVSVWVFVFWHASV